MEKRDLPDSEPAQDEQEQRESLGPMQVVASVFAAGLGVQSSKNRERDFKRGRPGIFIAAGIVFTLLFIATVATVVQLVIRGAGH